MNLMDINNIFCPEERKAWHSWLEQYSRTKQEVWLIFYKKHTGKAGITYNDAVEEALCFGWIDGIKKRVDEDRYSYRFTPRQQGSNWSEANIHRMEKLIREKAVLPQGLTLYEHWKAAGKEAVSAPRGVITAVPEDLNSALNSNPDAHKFFESLAPSYKRNFIAWINDAKKEETRIRRVNKAVDMLAKGIRSFM